MAWRRNDQIDMSRGLYGEKERCLSMFFDFSLVFLFESFLDDEERISPIFRNTFGMFRSLVLAVRSIEGARKLEDDNTTNASRKKNRYRSEKEMKLH